MNDKILPRSEIDPKYTWNLTSIFTSDEAWKTELDSVLESLSEFKNYQERLSESPAILADAMQARDNLFVRAQKVCTYASLSHDVDMTDQTAAKIASQAESLDAQVQAAISFIEPELLNIGEEVLYEWIHNEPRLAQYAHYIHDLFRKQAFVRSAEVEELLGMLTEPFSGTKNTALKLMNADLIFPSATTSDGGEFPITQNTIRTILTKEDQLLRQTAWERYTDTFLAFKNSFAGLLETSIKQRVFFMHARGHRSTLSASLFESNIPVEVFHNLLTTFRQHLPTWHRYWKIRRKALGVETMHPYDVRAPLTKDQFHIPYEQAVDWICKSLTPLGNDYVSVLRKGCLEDRWVDVYPGQGKVGGGFSAGSPGTHPFILLNYADDMLWFSGLAHELGHSMHSYLIWQHQPGIYCFDRKFCDLCG